MPSGVLPLRAVPALHVFRHESREQRSDLPQSHPEPQNWLRKTVRCGAAVLNIRDGIGVITRQDSVIEAIDKWLLHVAYHEFPTKLRSLEAGSLPSKLGFYHSVETEARQATALYVSAVAMVVASRPHLGNLEV